MSALGTPVQDDLQPQPQDHQLQIQQQQLADGLQHQQLHNGDGQVSESGRKPRITAKAPSVRRACAACHAGKTRCSEQLPCQSCIKRGIAQTCAYPDPDAENNSQTPSAPPVPFAPPPIPYPPPPMHSLGHPNYYDYNQPFPPAAAPTTPTPTNTTASAFRPNKRPRNLTDEEAAAITRNFTRGAFFIGRSEPIHIDPRLPVRLTLAEGDQVHFLIGEGVAPPPPM
ncbi:hypothetical protein BDY19DRAFT_74646 [Irpex rosettiformis]|uniref:Uncharacterized protein n=1 Tax=Irpex rosettiformis TaxID=378272 RepID=A0ACB8ULN0_9APHY|nr:hypothetical protein BDY19DRAFT_74646 [Irpex rosettiformis]